MVPARQILVALIVSTAPAHGQEAIAVPSGQVLSWVETVHSAPGPGGLTIRFRFLAPAIAREGGTVTADVAFVDMQFLCDTWVLPRLADPGPRPSQVIVSLSDRALPFGEMDPQATQFFEAYRPEDGACIWEGF